MLKSFESALTSVRSAHAAQFSVESEFMATLVGGAENGNTQPASFFLTAMALQSFGIVNEMINFTQTYTNFEVTLAGDETFVNAEGHILTAKKVKAYIETGKPLTTYKEWVRSQLQDTEFADLDKRIDTAVMFVIKGFKSKPSADAKPAVKEKYELRCEAWECFKAGEEVEVVIGQNAEGDNVTTHIDSSEGITVFMREVDSAKRAFKRAANAIAQTDEQKAEKATKAFESAMSRFKDSQGANKVQAAMVAELNKTNAFIIVQPTDLTVANQIRELLNANGFGEFIK